MGADHLAIGRRRVGVVVVLDHEHGWNVQHAREVQSLVDVAGAHRAVSPERERDSGLASPLERQRGANRDGAQVAEHRHEREHASLGHAEVHVAIAAARGPGPAAQEVPQHVGDFDAAGEVACELSVERRDDIVRAESEPRRGADRLLAAARVVAAGDPALAVERHGAIFDRAVQQAEA